MAEGVKEMLFDKMRGFRKINPHGSAYPSPNQFDVKYWMARGASYEIAEALANGELSKTCWDEYYYTDEENDEREEEYRKESQKRCPMLPGFRSMTREEYAARYGQNNEKYNKGYVNFTAKAMIRRTPEIISRGDPSEIKDALTAVRWNLSDYVERLVDPYLKLGSDEREKLITDLYSCEEILGLAISEVSDPDED